MISLNQLELWPKVQLSVPKPHIAITKPSMGQNGGKDDFLKPGVVIHSFSSRTILIEAIRINRLDPKSNFQAPI